MVRGFVVASLGLVLATAPASGQQRRFDLDALRRVVSVSDPVISPDGGSIVVVVSRPDYEQDRANHELVLVDVATGTQRVLTFERPAVSQPAWSPDGRQLGFLAAGSDGKQQVFVMPMAGGDARRLTDAPQGVQQFAWRPDGEAIAFVTMDETPKKEGEARHIDAFEVGNNDVFLGAPYPPSHIWLVPATGGKAKRLTSGSWTVEFSLPPGSPPSPLAWSPDGASLAFVRLPNTYTGNGDSSTIQILDVSSGAMHPLTGAPAFESSPAFAPDGKTIAYWYPRDGRQPGYWAGIDVYVAPTPRGKGRNVTRAIDRNFFLGKWLPDSHSLLVASNHETTVGLWRQPLDAPARRIDLGELVIAGAFGYDVTVGPRGAIALTASTADRPAELYYLESATATPRRLTNFNAWVHDYALGTMERVTWELDDFTEDGVLVYPPGFSPNRTYPLVLLIHGGPMSASKTSFSTLAQLMAAEGWLVFQPNYRGSDNLGSAYQRAIEGDAGAGPGRDVMAGVAELRKRAYVDPDRAAVTGWSYGGYMTTWLAGNYPDEWRAVMAGAAVTDLEDQYNLADFNVNMGYAMGGSPWVGDRQQLYRAQSPITYATNIKAPTLIMANTRDFRVPVVQSYKLFHALKDNGVTVKFITYPGRMHFPGDPVRSADVFKNWIDWVRTYLPGASARPVP